MKKVALLALLVTLFFTGLGYADCPNIVGYECAFYGGDLDPNDPNANALPNENDIFLHGNPYGAATYQNFVVSGNWRVSGLFTNNFSYIHPASAYWEIRTGVSEGNGGDLIASGMAAGLDFEHIQTGHSDFGYDLFADAALGLNVNLTAGTYWLAVVPQAVNQSGRSFNSNTFGLKQIGTDIPNEQFYNSPSSGANYINADNEGEFPAFSSGVLLTGPEPSSLIMLGSGLLAAVGIVRHRPR
jgi:hypothetical protein